ncbi:MAG TPA: hypothetical protein VFQ48_12205, partial [Pseudonocardiaceae bacterium]|nr:hypothetical protein [Pseudonocardiaceae bacterium]
AAEHAQGREHRLHSGTLSTPAEVEKAKRRETFTLAAAIAFGEHLDEPVERILAAADQPKVPTRVRAGDVAHLRCAIETLTARDSRAGGGAVRHDALAALRWATALRQSSCTPAVRHELAVLTAKLADLAAWVTFDCGYHLAAQQLSLLGLQAAREADDLGMRAWIASGLARQEIYLGHWPAGLELTQLAFTASDALTPNALADLHTVKALAYARKQDTAACLRCLGLATDTYRPDSISDEPIWLLDFTPARFERNLAFTRYYLLLGNADVSDRAGHRTALIESFSRAFRQYPPDAALNKAIIATRLATLLYQEGEQHTAHQTAEDVIALAGQVRSALLADDLRVLLGALRAGQSTDGDARDLRHRLSTVLTDLT